MGRPKLETPNFRLKRLPSGVFAIFWTEPSTGRTRRKTTGHREQEAAEIELARFRAGWLTPDPPDEPTISNILDGYLEASKEHRRSRAAEYACSALRRHLGALSPADVSDGVAAQYARDRRASSGTIRREMGVLRAGLHWAQRNKWIEQAPKFRMPVAEPAPRERWLTKEEAERLINGCRSQHVRLFIELALATAARKSALLGLRWSNADLDAGLVSFGRGTATKRRATVPISGRLREHLRTAYAVRASEYVIEYRGKKVAQIDAAFRAAVERAGLKDVVIHDLRRTSATWQVQAGVPLAKVARFLGDTEKMVEKVYGKHSPDYLREAAEALDF